jgi:membrane protein CcdC involved in cytochrome C biogenesis
MMSARFDSEMRLVNTFGIKFAACIALMFAGILMFVFGPVSLGVISTFLGAFCLGVLFNTPDGK